MQTESALHRVAREAALDLAADGVVYAEVRFAPELHQERGLSLDEVVDAVQRGFRDGEHQAAAAGHTVTVRHDHLRDAHRVALAGDRGAVRAASRRRRDDRGVRPRGRRDRLPAERPSRRDRDRSPRPRPSHAARESNSRSQLIADALDCGAERIGHGVRLIEGVTIDGGTPPGGLVDLDLDRVHLGPLATYVRDRQIPLELTPTWQRADRRRPDLADHPVALFHRLGIRATINHPTTA